MIPDKSLVWMLNAFGNPNGGKTPEETQAAEAKRLEGPKTNLADPITTVASHVAPVPRFNSVGEAQAWTKKQFGVELKFDQRDEQDWQDARGTKMGRVEGWDRDLTIQDYRTVAATLLRAQEAGVKLPGTVRVSYRDPVFLRDSDTMAYYRASENKISINRGYLTAYDKHGYMKSRDAENPGAQSTVLHELGHKQFDDHFLFDDHNAEQMKIAEKVSDYATTGKGEFIAEVYSQAAMGKKVDPQAMEYYKALGGPQIPRLVPEAKDAQQIVREQMDEAMHNNDMAKAKALLPLYKQIAKGK